ncbi:MAG TPA: flagellar motor switch protein FliG, partial [Clostridia bacterium]|nr:flagellar motor switch protein FliG [Clostridia bacterium]
MKSGTQELIGKEKAAVLLVALGTENAAEIMRHLKEDEIEQMTLEIANLRKVDAQTKESIIEEFYQICLAQNYINEGGIDYAKEVLERALGAQKAIELINRITSSLQVRPFNFIRK